MVSVCFYFQVHQPYRMRHYRIFDVGKSDEYFDESKNRAILEKVARKCYIPATKKLIEMLEKYPSFKFSFSFSGTVLEQLEEYCPEALGLFKKAVKSGRVEVLSETYYHSLSAVFSKEEFKKQIELHRNKIKDVFDYEPKVFRNTELIYFNELAMLIENEGFKGILSEGADHILGWRSPNFLYNPCGTKNLKLLLKNYRLSDDIAFRFSSKEWGEWPLKAERFSEWVNSINGNGTNLNLFMDYETFGEHQWEDTGIFDFIERLPEEILKHPDNDFKTPSELIESYESVGEVDVPYPISWADVERDLSAWLGNPMQDSAIKKLYDMEKIIMDSKNPVLIKNWRRLSTSDHFYYMCTKWFNDGDVHKYFSPYESPYDAFMSFMNILEDLSFRLSELEVIDEPIKLKNKNTFKKDIKFEKKQVKKSVLKKAKRKLSGKVKKIRQKNLVEEEKKDKKGALKKVEKKSSEKVKKVKQKNLVEEEKKDIKKDVEVQKKSVKDKISGIEKRLSSVKERLSRTKTL